MNKHSKLIREIIDIARNRILSLQDDWDGEGAKGYAEEVFDSAAKFLRKLNEISDDDWVESVCILLASEGSIDLHWKNSTFELLINFSADSLISYYGDNYTDNSIQGKCRQLHGSAVLADFISCWVNMILREYLTATNSILETRENISKENKIIDE